MKSLGSVCVGVLFIIIIVYLVDLFLNLNIEFITVIKENIIHYSIAFIAALSFFYWQSAKMDQKKWLYCSDLYNTLIQENHGNAIISKILGNALAIDLIILDLWAHRSFKELFCDELNQAVEKRADKYCLITKVNEKKLTEDEALFILQQYQDDLLEERDKLGEQKGVGSS